MELIRASVAVACVAAAAVGGYFLGERAGIRSNPLELAKTIRDQQRLHRIEVVATNTAAKAAVLDGIREFADKYWFAITITVSTPPADGVIIRLFRDDIKMLGVDMSEPSGKPTSRPLPGNSAFDPSSNGWVPLQDSNTFRISVYRNNQYVIPDLESRAQEMTEFLRARFGRHRWG